MKGIAAYVVTLAAVVFWTAGVQSAAPANAGSNGVSVVTTFNSVSLTASGKAASAMLELGTDSNYGLLIPDRRKKSHKFNVTGLWPATKYYYRITFSNASGKPIATTKGSFTTAVVGPANVSAANGRFLLNGAPAFVTAAMAFNVCPDQAVVDANAQLGLSVMIRNSGFSCPQSQDPEVWTSMLHTVLSKAGQMWWAEVQPPNVPATGPNGFPELLQWNAPRGFSYAPTLAISCDSQGLGEPELFDTVKKESARGPVLYQTFLRNRIGGSRMNCLTGPALSRLFWTVVAAGGGGLVFITQEGPFPGRGGNDPVTVNSDVAVQAKKQSLELAALQPALLAPAVSASAEGPLRVSAHRYRGATYVLAVNSGQNTARGVIRIKGSKAKVARVWRERRTVAVKSGSITDTLEPTEHHIYILR